MTALQLAMLNDEGDVAQAFPLAAASIAIGRHPDNDVRIQDERASRFHCAIEPDGAGGWRLKDLGSRNGTRLNDEAVTDAALSPGDRIRIGKQVFAILGGEPAAVRAEPRRREAREGAEARPQRVARAPKTMGGAPWVSELEKLLSAMAGEDGDRGATTLIDARGKRSNALTGESPGALALRSLILVAQHSRATDIHVEPKGDEVQVRMRVDGQMIQIVNLPNNIGELLIGMVRTACHLRTAGRDALQDGSFGAQTPGGRLDFRASLTPSVHGQKLVLRVLNAADAPQKLGELGLPPYMYDRMRKATERDAGLVLVCGPTGSGKTTTLYNALREIDRERRNVVTIEDPVEYHLDNVTQIPCNQDQGATFGSVLRSVLRQDPDVILVGEIRDEETARVAMQASMTGHLVFSTVHSKDTIGSVFRLLDLGVEPYLVANSLDVILAQRLVRLLCQNCRRAVRVSPGQATRMGRFLEGKSEVFSPTGCAQCLRTGFKGRRAIFELLDFNDELRDVVLKEPSIQAIRRIVGQGVFTTLRQSGWLLAARGETSLDEIDRVASSD